MGSQPREDLALLPNLPPPIQKGTRMSTRSSHPGNAAGLLFLLWSARSSRSRDPEPSEGVLPARKPASTPSGYAGYRSDTRL